MNKQIERKPFHESIISIINSCAGSDLVVLANIIKTTKIPKNHDAIIKAWKQKTESLGLNDSGVTDSILEQKQAIKDKLEDCLVSFDDFKNLQIGSKIYDRHGVDWIVELANCGELWRFPTHIFKCSVSIETCSMFHDGRFIRFWVEEGEHKGSICGNFL